MALRLLLAAGPGGIPDRVAGQIVTGIGFLGGGAILRSGKNVQGMTTAATSIDGITLAVEPDPPAGPLL